MMDIAQTVKGKRKQILEIAAKYGAYNVRVFGSTVRGSATEASDELLLHCCMQIIEYN